MNTNNKETSHQKYYIPRNIKPRGKWNGRLAVSRKTENLILWSLLWGKRNEDSKDPNGQTPVPECDPVLLGLFCKALLPLFIQTPHLSVLIQVSICLFCQREIWSVQIKIGTVLTTEDDSHRSALGYKRMWTNLYSMGCKTCDNATNYSHPNQV